MTEKERGIYKEIDMSFRYISLTHTSSKHRFQISNESMKEFINKGFRIQNTKQNPVYL